MLLELEPSEIAALMADDSLREEAVQEALRVLRDAGDERALRLNEAPVSKRPSSLSIDVAAAHEAQHAASAAEATGLTPALASIVRMSPRVTTNQFQTKNILSSAASGRQQK